MLTENQQKPPEIPEQEMCFFGGSTDHPCRWPATVQLDVFPDGHKVCRFHAATEPLWDEVNRLGLCVALIEDEFAPRAREFSHAGPLLELLERAREDFAERGEFLSGQLKAAMKAATEPQARARVETSE